MLVVFGGLPGTGKTTIARHLAARCSATYLRVDAIENAIRHAGVLATDIGPAGYLVANALAAANLVNGLIVVADCANPGRETRQAWRAIALRAQKRILEVEVVCSDPIEHRRRVERRRSDMDGLLMPMWQDVLDRKYEPWQEPRLVLDTARVAAEEAVILVERSMDGG